MVLLTRFWNCNLKIGSLELFEIIAFYCFPLGRFSPSLAIFRRFLADIFETLRSQSENQTSMYPPFQPIHLILSWLSDLCAFGAKITVSHGLRRLLHFLDNFQVLSNFQFLDIFYFTITVITHRPFWGKNCHKWKYILKVAAFKVEHVLTDPKWPTERENELSENLAKKSFNSDLRDLLMSSNWWKVLQKCRRQKSLQWVSWCSQQPCYWGGSRRQRGGMGWFGNGLQC